ncbi:MAG: DUF4352 domain-containing protein [Bacteroidota bacterium]
MKEKPLPTSTLAPDMRRCEICGNVFLSSMAICPKCKGKTFSQNLKEASKAIAAVLVIIVVIGLVVRLFRSDQQSVSSRLSENSNQEQPKSNSEATSYKVGEVVKTDYFQVTVNNVYLTRELKTGNEFIDEKYNTKLGNSIFLVIDATVKNIDSESRYFPNGILIANYNGKELKYDKAEDIVGYTFMYEQLNPLIEKTSKVVFRVPNELSGPLFWIPGRSSEKIFLGDSEMLVRTSD